jgi:HPt (histidine-containing phosphotransfer) domain-containing protein
LSDSEIEYSQIVQGIPERRFVRAGDVKRLVNRVNKLGLIMQVSRSLMGAIDLKKLLGEILSKTRVVMNADKASIFMIDEERSEIFASVTLDGSEIRLPRGAGIIGHVADTGDVVNIPDAYADARFNRDNDLKSGYRTKSILCMPVSNQNNQIIGAIQILNKLDDHEFTHEDEELLAAFTGVIGVCLENARAYEELEAERNSLEDKVAERTIELAMAKAETDQILQAVEEGLFLLYQSGDKFIIGAGHSQALSHIFEQRELRSKNFLGAIEQFLDAATLEKTRTFLELMFDPSKKQTVLLKLNPLANARAKFVASKREKFLRFHFSRVLNENATSGPGGQTRAAVDHLLVTVSDISNEVALQQKLERTEAQNRSNMELLHAILQSEPATLAEFLHDMNLDLDLAKSYLHNFSVDATDLLRESLVHVYRIVHSVKGNASILDFRVLTEMAHSLEGRLDALIAQSVFDEVEIHMILMGLGELEALSGEISSWLGRIDVFHAALAREKKADYLLQSLQSAFAKALASQGKQAELDTAGFDAALIAAAVRKPVKDMLLQLVRNSAVHGIESPDRRAAVAKPAVGKVRLSTQKDGDCIAIVVEDDGAGIDTAAVADRLIEKGRITQEQFAEMSEQQKYALIFTSGLSTLHDASEYAGRGMGMSIASDSAERIGAQIVIESSLGNFTRFVISYPA